ncbi:MAG TPA: alpha-hydroxy acid oxidase [Burkholderiales bacterium]|nr:alpha-hydroxy acid oxidase [Burkholderiales bacterium]
MPHSSARFASRRRLLKWLSGSPLLAWPGLAGLAAEIPQVAPPKRPDPMIWGPGELQDLIKDPKDAINVFDFEPVMRRNVPPAHFGYMASGIDDEITLRANREAFLKYYLRPRRLNDVSKVDTSVEIFGFKYGSPIFISPTGGNKAYHPDGELAVARAARAGNHLEMLATGATTSIEAAIEARGGPVWFQLYATSSPEVGIALVKRAEKAGSPVVAVTVDRVAGRNQETLFRLRRTDTRNCKDCHESGQGGGASGDRSRRPNYDGIDLSQVRSFQSDNMTWDYIRRLRDSTSMKIVLKGILTAEDATLAVKHGADGILVSNHGGRGEDSGRATIDVLTEVVEAVKGRLPVLVDSGFRRGTDVVKALAMGAAGVGVGRPYLWGLGAFGQPGVERVLELLRIETRAAMQQCGVRNVKELNPSFVRRV